eukprot:6214074-Pleurochrysis_carterae.AAC.2
MCVRKLGAALRMGLRVTGDQPQARLKSPRTAMCGSWQTYTLHAFFAMHGGVRAAYNACACPRRAMHASITPGALYTRSKSR